MPVNARDRLYFGLCAVVEECGGQLTESVKDKIDELIDFVVEDPEYDLRDEGDAS